MGARQSILPGVRRLGLETTRVQPFTRIVGCLLDLE